MLLGFPPITKVKRLFQANLKVIRWQSSGRGHTPLSFHLHLRRSTNRSLGCFVTTTDAITDYKAVAHNFIRFFLADSKPYHDKNIMKLWTVLFLLCLSLLTVSGQRRRQEWGGISFPTENESNRPPRGRDRIRERPSRPRPAPISEMHTGKYPGGFYGGTKW